MKARSLLVTLAAGTMSLWAFTALAQVGASPTAAASTPPLTAEDYFTRGSAEQAKGDLDGAIADYTKAIVLIPDDVA